MAAEYRGWRGSIAPVLEDVSHSTFADRVGETFTITAPDGNTLELTLAEATLAPEGEGVPGGRAPFSLIFHGPASPYAPQGTWHVEHAELEELELFLVPLGPDGDVMRYQAVFS
jgi:hypothetical protein